MNGLSGFLLCQSLLLGLCSAYQNEDTQYENYTASDIVTDFRSDKLIEIEVYFWRNARRLDSVEYYYHKTQVVVDVELNTCGVSCSPPRFIPRYNHPKTPRMCIFAHYDENSLTCTKYIRETVADAARLPRIQGCGDKTNGTLIVREHYHFLQADGFQPDSTDQQLRSTREIGKLHPLVIIDAIDRKIEVSGAPVQFTASNNPFLFRLRIAVPDKAFDDAVEYLPYCKGGDCGRKQDEINVEFIQTYISQMRINFRDEFFGAGRVSFRNNNGTGILWSEFYREGFKQLLENTMTSDQGQVECVRSTITCGNNKKQLMLKSSALRYQIPGQLRVRTQTTNAEADLAYQYGIILSTGDGSSYRWESIPRLRENTAYYGGTRVTPLEDNIQKNNIDPAINGNDSDKKMCELMVAESKKEGGAALDEVYEVLCDFRMGTFRWGKIVADLTQKINNDTCEFPKSIEFTDEMIGPAHDAMYRCLYDGLQPLDVWPLVGGVVGALAFLTLVYCFIIKKKKGSNAKSMEHDHVGGSTGGDMPMTKQVNTKTNTGGEMLVETSTDNPQYEL